MSRAILVAALQARRIARRRWSSLVLVAGILLAGVAAAVAATHEGLERTDSLRQGSATLLLLGGLVVALGLGSPALNRDSDSGHFGALMGAGVNRGNLVAGALIGRTATLAAILAVWGIALQIGSVALGLGLDAQLAVHTLLVAEALLLTMLAAAAASSVVPPVAAGAFGLVVYITAQAMMNLKAAADQDYIGVARDGVNAAYYLMPHIPTSEMIAELQLRDAAGPAVPRVDINGNEVLLGASGWGTIAWTLAWCAVLGLLAYAGIRRRPIN